MGRTPAQPNVGSKGQLARKGSTMVSDLRAIVLFSLGTVAALFAFYCWSHTLPVRLLGIAMALWFLWVAYRTVRIRARHAAAFGLPEIHATTPTTPISRGPQTTAKSHKPGPLGLSNTSWRAPAVLAGPRKQFIVNTLRRSPCPRPRRPSLRSSSGVRVKP